MTISVYEKADTFDLKWQMLKKCLHFEAKQCKKCIKDALKSKHYSEANNIYENLATVEWVLDEIENIEEKGVCL